MDVVLDIVAAFWYVLALMSPYLLLGFLIAGVLSVVLSPAFVERHLGGHGLWPAVKASLMGVPLPLCSCGVIPVAASLRRHGASRSATTSFLLSTPQTGVDSIAITYSLLGPVFAIFRPVVALVTGIIGGAMTLLFGEKDAPTGGEDRLAKCSGDCCSEAARKRNPLVRILKYGFVTLAGDLAKSLAIGLAIAALITALVPVQWLATLRGGGIWTMLLMMAVGIPMYSCSSGSVPIAAALMMGTQGITPGAAFVFLTTGPATNAATIATVWKTMGHRTAAVYLSAAAVCALGGGILLDSFVGATGIPAGRAYHQMALAWWQHGAGILLVIVLGISVFRPLLTRKPVA